MSGLTRLEIFTACLFVGAGVTLLWPQSATSDDGIRWEMYDIPGNGFGQVATTCLHGTRVFVAKDTGNFSGNPIAVVGDMPMCEP